MYARDWRLNLNIKVGVLKYSGGNSDFQNKSGHFGWGNFFFFSHLSIRTYYEEAEEESYRLRLQMTQVGVREGVLKALLNNRSRDPTGLPAEGMELWNWSTHM